MPNEGLVENEFLFSRCHFALSLVIKSVSGANVMLSNTIQTQMVMFFPYLWLKKIWQLLCAINLDL